MPLLTLLHHSLRFICSVPLRLYDFVSGEWLHRKADDLAFTLPPEDDDPWQSEARGELAPLRRALIVLRPREPYARWVRTKVPDMHEHTLERSRESDCIVLSACPRPLPQVPAGHFFNWPSLQIASGQAACSESPQ